MKVLLAHGSSDATHAIKVVKLANDVSLLLGESVEACFLSDLQLPAGSEVLPLFLGAGVHLTEDAPRLAAASGSTLLPGLPDQSGAIASLVGKSDAGRSIYLLYQPEGFEALQCSLETQGAMAYLHGDPSLTTMLQQHAKTTTEITVQPLLLFPGRSLARVRSMIADSNIPDIRLAPVLCELNGFAELVADCFRRAQ